MFKSILAIFFTLLLFTACEESSIPRPHGHIRMEYPKAQYKRHYNQQLPYTFEYSRFANMINRGTTDLDLIYPGMRATLYLSYKPVKDNNLKALLSDAQKKTYEHSIKASGIIEHPFVHPDAQVYGTLYEVEGDAATNLQFYVTDSTKHVLTGALYFYVTPNYDSILPALNYIKQDVGHLIETLTWSEDYLKSPEK